MDTRAALIKMLQQLLDDTYVIAQQGAGYYSCIPVIHRYNKLLHQARTLFHQENSLINTFEDQPEQDPNDPADKLKVMQGIRVEVGQLMSLLQALGDEQKTAEDTPDAPEPAEEGSS